MRREAELGSEVRRRFLRVRGRGVHYLRARSGPPVVMLHAGMSSANWTLPLMRKLLTPPPAVTTSSIRLE